MENTREMTSEVREASIRLTEVSGGNEEMGRGTI